MQKVPLVDLLMQIKILFHFFWSHSIALGIPLLSLQTFVFVDLIFLPASTAEIQEKIR